MPEVVYRSLYWRIALGFIICIASVLAVQAAVLLALLNRGDVDQDALTRAASASLVDAMANAPGADLQQHLRARYPRPPAPLFAVLASGDVLTAGRRSAPPARVVETALRELQRRPVRALPAGWQGDPYHASPIVVGGEVVGAVAVVPETWVERLWPSLLATSVGLLLAGTTMASVFIFGPAHRRLKELESAALRLGAGDMSVRARDDGGDEVARVARAFNQMAGDLAASDRARRLLLADVSHELMTPLTAVRGYQERLAADPVVRASEHLSQYAAVIGDDALRMERIVGDLLDLAKLEGGGDRLDRQDVSVEGLFGRVAARHTPDAARKSIAISTTIAPGAEIAFGDRFRLEQALQNLAANAIRHAPSGGRVELRAELNGSGTTLTVADNGPGIARDHLPFVFDRFFKADPSRSNGSGGSGLGLSIVRAIVERHGGTIGVSSEPAHGTVFTIVLPGSGAASRATG